MFWPSKQSSKKNLTNFINEYSVRLVLEHSFQNKTVKITVM